MDLGKCIQTASKYGVMWCIYVKKFGGVPHLCNNFHKGSNLPTENHDQFQETLPETNSKFASEKMAIPKRKPDQSDHLPSIFRAKLALVGGFNQPIWKILYSQNGFIFPKFRDENSKKYEWNHHLAAVRFRKGIFHQKHQKPPDASVQKPPCYGPADPSVGGTQRGFFPTSPSWDEIFHYMISTYNLELHVRCLESQ